MAINIKFNTDYDKAIETKPSFVPGEVVPKTDSMPAMSNPPNNSNIF